MAFLKCYDAKLAALQLKHKPRVRIYFWMLTATCLPAVEGMRLWPYVVAGNDCTVVPLKM